MVRNSTVTDDDRISAAIDDVEIDHARTDRSSDGESGDGGESVSLSVEEALDDTPSYASLEPAGPVRISAVDARAFPEVSVHFRVATAAGADGDLAGAAVEIHEDGTARDPSLIAPDESTADVVFVFDDVGSMLEEVIGARTAVASVVDGLATAGVDARYALVAARERVAVAQAFTADRSALLGAVEGLSGSLGADRQRHPLDAIGVATGNAEDDAGRGLSSFREDAHRVLVNVTDAPANLVDAGAGGTDASGPIAGPLATALRGFSYVEVSDARDELRGAGAGDPGDATPVATAVGGAWFERPGSSVDAFARLLKREITPLVATTYTATYTSDAGSRDPSDRPIRLVIDDPDEGELVATWGEGP